MITIPNKKLWNNSIHLHNDKNNQIADFLCPPVSKQQMVEECGLSEDYLITDLNPASLGLNLAEAEIITGGNLYDELNFQCYELQTE